ncbi:hypothetical protein GCM10023238_18570 [Streptomyces heliomycini]
MAHAARAPSGRRACVPPAARSADPGRRQSDSPPRDEPAAEIVAPIAIADFYRELKILPAPELEHAVRCSARGARAPPARREPAPRAGARVTGLPCGFLESYALGDVRRAA